VLASPEPPNAYTHPATTTIGQAAPIPQKNLKTANAGKFGASALAMVQMAKNAKANIMTYFLPYCSDMGPKKMGPTTYPRRKRDVGRMRRALEEMPKSRPKNSEEFEARPLDTVEFMTQRIETHMTNIFLYYHLVSICAFHCPIQ
jgi:hypothetical protein